MPKDYKRHLKSDMQGGFYEIEKSKSKTVPREIEHSIFLSMVKDRDMAWIAEGKFVEHLTARHDPMSYMKSAKPMKIEHETEAILKRRDRHEEDNIVAKWGKQFKVDYPNVPFTIDKVAQSRSMLGGVMHKSSQYRKGNPDIFIQSPQAGYAGCFIEQKKSDNIFYKGTRILKPGSDNQHIWQSLYHADLRQQGYWVMFSISYESTKKMTDRYMAGNPYAMQVFDYYCSQKIMHNLPFTPHLNQ